MLLAGSEPLLENVSFKVHYTFTVRVLLHYLHNIQTIQYYRNNSYDSFVYRTCSPSCPTALEKQKQNRHTIKIRSIHSRTCRMGSISNSPVINHYTTYLIRHSKLRWKCGCPLQERFNEWQGNGVYNMNTKVKKSTKAQLCWVCIFRPWYFGLFLLEFNNLVKWKSNFSNYDKRLISFLTGASQNVLKLMVLCLKVPKSREIES